jgi:transposase-like protein
VKLTYSRIRKILRDPIYIGYLNWGKYGKGEEKFYFPELKCIDKDTFNKAQLVIAQIKKECHRDEQRIPKTILDFIDNQGLEPALEIIEIINCITLCCPKCKSTALQKNGKENIGGVMRYKFICKSCGHEFRVPSKKMMKQLEKSIAGSNCKDQDETDLAENQSAYEGPNPKIPANELSSEIKNQDKNPDIDKYARHELKKKNEEPKKKKSSQLTLPV